MGTLDYVAKGSTGLIRPNKKRSGQPTVVGTAERARTDVQKGRGIRYTTVHKPAAG